MLTKTKEKINKEIIELNTYIEGAKNTIQENKIKLSVLKDLSSTEEINNMYHSIEESILEMSLNITVHEFKLKGYNRCLEIIDGYHDEYVDDIIRKLTHEYGQVHDDLYLIVNEAYKTIYNIKIIITNSTNKTILYSTKELLDIHEPKYIEAHKNYHEIFQPLRVCNKVLELIKNENN